MDIGLIGLGKMGSGIAHRLQAGGHQVIVYDRDPAAVQRFSESGVAGTTSLAELVQRLSEPHVVWVMLPAGDPVEQTLFGNPGLERLLGTGDIIVDGGNSFFEDTQRRAIRLAEKHIAYVDVGVSGGVRGVERGYCLMVGGEKAAVDRIQPVLRALGIEGGIGHVGPSGAGHFVKMIHNGIEYGMMESLAEGTDLLAHGPVKDLDLAQIAGVWSHGSIIESFLLELLEDVVRTEDLSQVRGTVGATGEGQWAVATARESGIAVPAMEAALSVRGRSQTQELYTAKILALLRNRFGGHEVQRTSP